MKWNEQTKPLELFNSSLNKDEILRRPIHACRIQIFMISPNHQNNRKWAEFLGVFWYLQSKSKSRIKPKMKMPN